MSSTNETYFLNWHQHANNFSRTFSDLLENKQLVDVQLVAEGHLISAHRLILSAMSPYFCNMFSQMPANQQAFVFLKDISKKTVTDLITYIYRGEVNVKQDSIDEFIGAAQALNIKGLADGSFCKSFESQPFDIPPANATFNGSTYRTPIFNHPSSSAIDQYQSVQRSTPFTLYQQPMNGYQQDDQNQVSDRYGNDSELNYDENFEDENSSDPWNDYNETSFDQRNGESDINENESKPMESAPKRYKPVKVPSAYDSVANIQTNQKGHAYLVYANNKFNKSGKPNGRDQQRWKCTKEKSRKCRAAVSTMEVNDVTMMMVLMAEHSHVD